MNMSKKNEASVCPTCGVVSTHTSSSGWGWLVAILVVVLLVALTACGSGGSPRGELAADQQTLSTCDPSSQIAADVQVDGSGSSASDAIVAERMTAIESIVRRSAICGSRLRVSVFTASSAASTVLYDAELKMPGATDNARLKKVPGAVADTMAKIKGGYGSAVASLPQGGSDITAQLRLSAEWLAQLGGSYRLRLVILTDGFQNVRVDLGARAFSKQEAVALAGQAAVPQLSGASVVVAGLGRVAEGAPPSSVVEGLVAYYSELCRISSAAECTAVTDYAVGGR
jgi:hypothetical protein